VPQGGRQFVVKVVAPTALPAAAASGIAPDTKFVSLRQEVRLGVRQAGKVEITEGLAEGETVVVAGQQRLQRDGTPVRIVETTSVPGLGRPSPPASAAVAGASPAGVPPKP
jgi:membrane fusion protein (multidrug efflux system)